MSDASVTIVFIRSVKAGRERDYERWLLDMQEAMRGVDGYLGVQTTRPPSGAARREYVTVVRFRNVESLRAWETSELRQSFLAKLPADAVEGDAEVQRLEGLEFWFEPPGTPPAAAPSIHKMALVVFVVVATLVNLLSPVAAWLLPGVPLPIRTTITIAFQVTLMTYVIMPRLTRLLGPWLFSRGR